MSRELHLYCQKRVPRKSLELVIAPLGFRRMDSKVRGVHWYFWFEEKNLASMRGCHLFYQAVDKPDEWSGASRKTSSVFIAKTFVGRGYEDFAQQNAVIRELRRHFGGALLDEWNRRRGYIANDIPQLTFGEKKCGLVLNKFRHVLWSIQQLPSDPSPEEAQRYHLLDQFGVPLLPPSILHNNALVPLIVASLENFFRELFVAYVGSQAHISGLIYERQARVDYERLRGLVEGNLTIAELEASNYSFQSWNSVNAAYERYFGINLLSMWNRRRLFKGTYYNIRQLMQEVVDLRHRIIHEGHFDPQLDELKISRYLDCAERSIALLIAGIERKRFRMDLERFL